MIAWLKAFLAGFWRGLRSDPAHRDPYDRALRDWYDEDDRKDRP